MMLVAARAKGTLCTANTSLLISWLSLVGEMNHGPSKVERIGILGEQSTRPLKLPVSSFSARILKSRHFHCCGFSCLTMRQPDDSVFRCCLGGTDVQAGCCFFGKEGEEQRVPLRPCLKVTNYYYYYCIFKISNYYYVLYYN